MSPTFRRTLSLFLLACASVSFAGQPFENTAIVRTVELGGSVVHVTTTYAIRALEENQRTYTVAFGAEDKSKTSWLEAKVKGQKTKLKVKERGLDASNRFQLADITLPNTLPRNKTLNLVVETVQTHATWPCPATAAQNEDQALKYKTELFVLSPYATVVQRTKLKALAPRIIDYTIPKEIQTFSQDRDFVTKTGATAVYGPYDNLPPSTNAEFVEKYQQPITIHYHHEQPVLEVTTLHRGIEISHWGANINTEDKFILHNAGPQLKGHFSRLEHQHQQFYKRPAPHVLPALTLHLPSGIRNTYYYDLIGNVSTSHLRVAPSTPKNRLGTQFSVLEFRPRYPVLGSWNYTFTLGYDAPLEDSASYDKSTGKFIVEIPVMTPILGSVINNEHLTITLPEGARDIEFTTPYPARSNSIDTIKTYLDTTGRPQLTFQFENLTVKHAESLFVSYKVSTAAHFKKPIAVFFAFLSLFTLAMITRRVNLTLNQPSKKLS